MKTKESKRYKVIQNPDLENALRGYRPEFGNRLDMLISRKIGSLNRKMALVDNEVLRGMKKQEKGSSFSGKMREILSLERSLIGEITSRNFDF